MQMLILASISYESRQTNQCCSCKTSGFIKPSEGVFDSLPIKFSFAERQGRKNNERSVQIGCCSSSSSSSCDTRLKEEIKAAYLETLSASFHSLCQTWLSGTSSGSHNAVKFEQRHDTDS